MSNRVDELERKVKDLQAAVNGLTEELVESKERIRQLENAVEVDDPAVRAKSPADSAEAESASTDSSADTAAEGDADAGADTDAPEAREQRFVDAEEHEPELEERVGPEGSSDEEAKAAEEKEEETESEQSETDIIVA
jgi:hypothetical protein